MSRIVRMLVLLLAVLASPLAWAQSDERILDYTIAVDVRADGSLEVTEDITVRAAGDQIRRGIYRDFPTRYRDGSGNAVVVALEVLSVQRNGDAEPWFIENRINGVRINTGGEDYLPELPGEYRYTLRYRTTRQLGFFADHDELYWNAIGTGWAFPIDRGRVEVRLPQAVPVANMTAEGYTGPQGAKGQDYRTQITAPGTAVWELTRPLEAGEGLTVVLGFPKGLVPEPSTGQRLAWLLSDNRGILVALAGFVLLLVYCIRRWRQVGRDPRAGTIIARYDPPQDRSPAELRFLRRRGYDTRCFTGDLLVAAVDGEVAIEREDRLLRKDRWQLQRLDGGGGPPRLHTPGVLMGALFGGGERVLELIPKNAGVLQGAHFAHAKALDKRLHGSHFSRNVGSAVVAVVIAIATGISAFMVSAGSGIPLIVGICVLMLLVVMAFGRLVQAPTAEGRKLLDEIEGLKLYLGVAERDELANLQGPGAPPLDAQRYERLLPYAVALDVEDAWTKKFTLAVGAAAAAAATSAIAWYHGGNISDMGSLAQSIGSGLNSSIASASTPPGSSSGGGGGGSSGGGGGGGGGGGR